MEKKKTGRVKTSNRAEVNMRGEERRWEKGYTVAAKDHKKPNETLNSCGITSPSVLPSLIFNHFKRK